MSQKVPDTADLSYNLIWISKYYQPSLLNQYYEDKYLKPVCQHWYNTLRKPSGSTQVTLPQENHAPSK